MLRLLASALSDVATGVLALAGLIKLFDPRPWVAAIGGLRPSLVRHGRRLRSIARAVGVAELATVGIVVIVGGRIGFALLALAYTTFSIVAAVAVRRGTSCGCFGARSVVATTSHVASNAVATVAAVVCVALDTGSFVDRWRGPVTEEVAYVAFLVFGVVGVVALLTAAAELSAATRAASTRTATPRRPRVGQVAG